jgi:hypothetical protein
MIDSRLWICGEKKVLLVYSATPMKKSNNIPRAEKRRMARDPLYRSKVIAGMESAPEYDRLVSYGQILVFEMSQIQERMNGLGFTPKKLRAQRQEELTERWNVLVEKIEQLQKDMAEIEAEEKKKTSPLIEV